MPVPWWQSGVLYQIYPRSFCDTDGDGVGDLEGIRRHLDHVAGLGVDAVWVSPFYPSPMADAGYDVSDYCDVDPRFGTLGHAEALVDEAHARGLRVVVDLVPNHTSDLHPWFLASRSSRTDPKRDWYIWRDPAPDGGPPNNWIAAFTNESAWELDDKTGQYYLHLFLPAQPDLNWANPDVVAAMHGVMRFWLDRGVDGFRVDVVHCIGKDDELPDDEPPWAGIPHCVSHEHPSTHDHIRAMRELLDSYPGDRVLIGETALPQTRMIAAYYGDGDELHLAFNFAPLYAPWDDKRWRRRIERVAEELEPRGAWPTWVLSNHDNSRHRTRFGGSEARARAAAVLLLTLRGTPFVYQGEELGLEDAVIEPDRLIDPGGRDGCRAPIPWTTDAPYGWATDDPWLPWPPDAGTRSVEALDGDASSILGLYRRLLAARRASPALTLGELVFSTSPPGALAYERRHDGDRRAVVVSFSSEGVDVHDELRTGWVIQLRSDGDGSENGDQVPAVLPPDTAFVLRRS